VNRIPVARFHALLCRSEETAAAVAKYVIVEALATDACSDVGG
jgi:hypothetical protein